jgi:Kef-type K+ transport system membrane component KefB
MVRGTRIPIVYAGSVAASVSFFLLIRLAGSSLFASSHLPPSSGHVARVPSTDAGVLIYLLLALAVVMVTARAVGLLFRKLNQPEVMGEVIAGILLGPSFLGRITPVVASNLFPQAVASYMGIVSQVGIILYMFLVGLEFDIGLLRRRTEATVAISHASIMAPFLLGGVLALWLYPRYASQDVPFTPFALFVGVAMSVTAFPVLARILRDRGLQNTTTGVLALACAAIDDVTAWCLLALVVAVARAEPRTVVLTVAMTLGFILFMILVAKHGAMWLVRKQAEIGQTTHDIFATVCLALLVSAMITERIGIHALFGAFLLGTLIPHDSALARDIRDKCEDLVLVLLLPLFFAFTGMRTQLGLITTPRDWLACVLIILMASAGKFGGSFLAARLTGSSWRQAVSLGALMNTRGLMELVVLNVGLDLRVLSPALFSLFVIMAIVTTLAAGPILQLQARSDGGQIE